MSTVDAPTKLGAVHMRLVYFKTYDTPQLQLAPPSVAPVTPADLTRVFRQIELLMDYAQRITPTLTARLEGQTGSGTLLNFVRVMLEQSGESAKHKLNPTAPDDLAGIVGGMRDPEHIELQLPLPPDVDPSDIKLLVTSRYREGAVFGKDAKVVVHEPVSVIGLRMGSPLDVLLEIPPATWPLLGFGLLALTERIATMPVRIARKRKEELLESAKLDRQTAFVNEGRADVLAELLLGAGPATASALDEVSFIDPGDPDDELVEISPAPAAPG